MSGWFAIFKVTERSFCGKNTKNESKFGKLFWIHTSILWKSTKCLKFKFAWLHYSWFFFIIFFVTLLSQASKGFQISLSHFLIFFGCFQFADVLVRLNVSALSWRLQGMAKIRVVIKNKNRIRLPSLFHPVELNHLCVLEFSGLLLEATSLFMCTATCDTTDILVDSFCIRPLQHLYNSHSTSNLRKDFQKYFVISCISHHGKFNFNNFIILKFEGSYEVSNSNQRKAIKFSKRHNVIILTTMNSYQPVLYCGYILLSSKKN